MFPEAPAWLDALAFGAPEKPKAPAAAPPQDRGPASPAVLEAARQRLVAHGPAVMNERGNDHTVVVGAILYRDFALEEDEAWPLALEWNATCQPSWDEDELKGILANGARYGSGLVGAERAAVEADLLLRARPQVAVETPGVVSAIPKPADFTPVLNGDYGEAQGYVLTYLQHEGKLAIRKWNETYFYWGDPPGCYRAITEGRLRVHLLQRMGCDSDKVTRKYVAAVEGVPGVLIDEAEKPSWLAGEARDPREYTLARGALLHLPTGDVLPPTPDYFCTATLGVAYDPAAPPPTRWLQFLEEVLPNDPEARSALQEWFGYCLVPDVRQQKILYLYGQPRCGKGTIIDALSDLVGPDSAASPSLAMLATNFGMMPLIDKLVAIIPDARIDPRADTSHITEKLLMVSGADKVTLDRKYKDHWRGRLTTRFVISSNDLIEFRDPSGALASRLITIHLTESFLDREDQLLGEKIRAELPGILLWAIEGWRRLKARGHFILPASAKEANDQMQDATTPVRAWLRECCTFDPAGQIACDVAFGKYIEWASRTRHRELSSTAFGRDLRSAYPSLKRIQARIDGKRTWVYCGVREKTGDE